MSDEYKTNLEYARRRAIFWAGAQEKPIGIYELPDGTYEVVATDNPPPDAKLLYVVTSKPSDAT